jgi:hypothetical protein
MFFPICHIESKFEKKLLGRFKHLGRWFSTGTPVSSNDKNDHHDITEILLKVALNIIKPTNLLV